MYIFSMYWILHVMVGRGMGVETGYKWKKYFRIK